MQLSVTGHHIEVTPALRGYVEKKLERITRHFDHVLDVHCVLTVEKLSRKRKPRFTSAAAPSMRTRSIRTCMPPSTP
jgi:putative sigma-54 modulation protein